MTSSRTAAGRGTATPPGGVRLPFPIIDEVSRHCLSDDEPETVHVEVHLPGRLDPARLRTAFRRALLTHPRVLMREVPGRWHRQSFAWELTGEPDSDPVSFTRPGPDALGRARARALTECPSLALSPPMRLEVIEVHGGTAAGGPPEAGVPGATRTVLLLTMHHTALDAGSGLRVLATTAERYGGSAALPVPGPVRPDPSGPAPAATDGTGRAVCARPVRVAPDSRPEPVRARAAGNGMLQAELPVPPRVRRTGGLAPWTVNDQLLVAASLMVGRWNVSQGRPAGPVRITMPVDDRPRGREMPMGNGTRLVEVAMTSEDPRDTDLLLGERPDLAAVARLLGTTARRTRALKSAQGAPLGSGASLLTARLLPVGIRGALTRGARRAAAPWTSTALVTNIGRVPYSLDFGDAGRANAVWFSAPARMPRGLSVAAASTDGRLHVTLRWSRALLGDAAGAHLAGLFEQSLSTTSQVTRAGSNAWGFGPEADTPEADATAPDPEAPGARDKACRPGGPYDHDALRPDPTPGGSRSARENRGRPS
ncbi:condensation protein [Streptomyces lunaelactis]|uniref:condensation protein n=1 Tax=Streptomyces lunaelactis TaxID=1535768 RepID=UPI001584D8A6|nr:condensation protein [Streptomyces lunaelactis]NUK21873.1 condensation protein [Streptomyces lunaelactis]NUK58156.1 condensation protein [Streptomyces lunaelactis]